MLFTSISFYMFALLTLVLAMGLPFRLSRWILICASYLFYGAAEPWYCLLLFGSTAIDFMVAHRIHAAAQQRVRRNWLMISLIANLSLLCIFKYAGFAADNLSLLLRLFGDIQVPHLNLILPIGISFYTFQTLSYTIDVYRGRQTPTRSFPAFALYVAFFPQLVAGPIERARNLLTQFERPLRTSLADVEYGIQRILWGLAKKLILADRFALVVASVYHDPASFSAAELLLATLCFSFQLYLDFSAYTDIAIGLASLFGIRLSENFNYPFLARNPSDFWTRWHITLTNWFRDYVFQSLGGTRRGAPLRTAASILLVMGLMGLWHGAEWHYVVFGLLSGTMVVVYITTRLATGRRNLLGTSWLSAVASVLIMNVVINFIMIFFRADNLAVAMQIIKGIGTGYWTLGPTFLVPGAVLAATMLCHFVLGSRSFSITGLTLGPIWKGLLCAALVYAINYLSVSSTEQFLYFRF